MAYIHNGRVVEKKPFTLKGFLLAIWAAISLFLNTLFTFEPMTQRVEEHQRPAHQRGGGGGGFMNSLRGLLNRGRGQALGAAGNNGNGNGGSSWAAAVNRRGANIHSLPKAPISGGCGGGG